MGRQARRAARRTREANHGLACGCITRRLRPLQTSSRCKCGAVTLLQDVTLPTSAPLGGVKHLWADCSCGAEVMSRYVVRSL